MLGFAGGNARSEMTWPKNERTHPLVVAVRFFAPPRAWPAIRSLQTPVKSDVARVDLYRRGYRVCRAYWIYLNTGTLDRALKRHDSVFLPRPGRVCNRARRSGVYGTSATSARTQLYCRMVWNVLVPSVDNDLQNHGFLWRNRNGRKLASTYAVNPTFADLRQRAQTTRISLDGATCEIKLAHSVIELSSIASGDADNIIGDVARLALCWRGSAG